MTCRHFTCHVCPDEAAQLRAERDDARALLAALKEEHRPADELRSQLLAEIEAHAETKAEVERLRTLLNVTEQTANGDYARRLGWLIMSSSRNKGLKVGDVLILGARLGEVVAVHPSGDVTVATMIETATYVPEYLDENAMPVTADGLRLIRLLPHPDEGVRGFTHDEAAEMATAGAEATVARANRRPAFHLGYADAIRREGRERDLVTGRASFESEDRRGVWRDGWKQGLEAAARKVENVSGAWDDKAHGLVDEIRALRAPEVKS